VFPVGIGLGDPRSQKRDLGHPSISPFDIAEGHMLCHFSPDSQTASRLLGMTKERATLSNGKRLLTRERFFVVSGGTQAHDHIP
jgi:hypothetical protein